MNYILSDLEGIITQESIEREITDKVNKTIAESNREYYLREKIKAIQEELGDKARREDEIETIRTRILEKGMNKEMEEKALKELAKYRSQGVGSAESSYLRNYLDFLLELPFKEVSPDNEDLNKVQTKLDQDHYGLEKVKERIIEYLAVKIKTKHNPQTILCLVGPPGVGKTSLAASVAQALNRKFVKQALGGVRDEAEIRGHRRTYVGALPGRILSGMARAGTINPVFLLDEIDKMGNDYKGDPADAMLEVLDPEQNSKFSDHYLEEPYDLSQVLFITTANYMENIPAPLYDRMEIIELSSYTEIEKFEIAKRHLLHQQLEAHGSNDDEFKITDAAIYAVIRGYTREAGVRQLKRTLGSLIRKVIKQVLMEGKKEVLIDENNLTDFLGKPIFSYNEANSKEIIGQVTGLAWTQAGGDILPIEVAYYKGRGQLVLTGKLGEVMKESAMTALSYVKSKAEEFHVDPNIFNEYDFHMHAPEGAIPKDGPSAGITIATAILSAVTRKPVKLHLGMTGEITLSGQVLPIGGLREKSIAALRSGLNTILIPKANEKNLVDIPEEVKSKLQILLVDDVKEVFALAFA
jgi:ATP-dependent Lon protease